MYTFSCGNLYGTGCSAWSAIVNAFGNSRLANIFVEHTSKTYHYSIDDGVREANIYSVNGVKIGTMRQY